MKTKALIDERPEWPVSKLLANNEGRYAADSRSGSGSNPDNPLLEAALRYARLGWRIFPIHTVKRDGACSCGRPDCAAPGKHPRTAHGFKDATTDEGQIVRWWTELPDSNIGVATGAVSGIVVLDIDGADGLAAMQAMESADFTVDTAVQGTRRGFHFIYRHPGDRRIPSAKIAPQVDLKGDGGYVVVAPSRHLGGEYSWFEGRAPGEVELAPLPDTLLSRTKEPTISQSGADVVPEPEESTLYARGALRDETARVRAATNGERNNILNAAAFRMGQLIGKGELRRDEAEEELLEAACEIDLPVDEAERTIRSGIEGGILQPRAVVEAVDDPAESHTAENHRGLVLRACDVEKRPVAWLWRNHLALGKLHIIDGDPGLGKSLLTLDLAARITTGAPWPDGEPNDPPGTVLLLSAEDAPGDTIRPRLEAAGADLTRVGILTPTLDSTGKLLALPTHIKKLEEEVRNSGARLLVIDPLTAFLDRNLDPNRDHDVRRVLTALSQMAERTGVAVVIVRHLNKKTDVGKALYRGGGSIGIIAAARLGFVVAKDKGDPDLRVFAGCKNNLGPLPKSLSYRVVEAEVVIGDETTEVARIEWEGESALTSDELLQDEAVYGGSTIDSACDFLHGALQNGPRQSSEVEQMALERGISKKTLERARDRLHVVAKREAGRWFLALPVTTNEAA